MKRAIVVSGDSQIIQDVKAVLPLANYNILSSMKNGLDALRTVHRLEPDLLVVGPNIQGIQGYDLLQTLITEHICPLIVVLSEEYQEELHRVIDHKPNFTLIHPFRAIDMMNAVFQAEVNFINNRETFLKIKNLEEELKTRKIIYQAILKLVEEGLTEESAFTQIRKQAMTTRKTIRSISTDVIKGLWRPNL